MGTSRQAAPQVRVDKEGGVLADAGAWDRFAAAQGPSDHTQAAVLSHDKAYACAMTHACGMMQVASAGPLTNKALAAKLEAERKLKEGISGHRTGLPKKLLELFAPLPLPGVLPELRKRPPKVPYTGIGQYVAGFADKGEPEYEPAPEVPPPFVARPASPRIFKNPELPTQARFDYETRAEKCVHSPAAFPMYACAPVQAKEQIEDGLQDWDPAKDDKAESDPFKTLFVGRISYDATEKKLRREFEEYGPIKHIRLVNEKRSGKPRGYAFIEYEHKNDMKTAYKMADGRKVEGRRVIVDVERGRTVPNWRPRRLGGGKGGESREPKPPKKAGKGLPVGLPGPPPSSAAPPPRAVLPPPPVAAERPRCAAAHSAHGTASALTKWAGGVLTAYELRAEESPLVDFVQGEGA
ncbi:MAG: hypothetical protein MMC33_004261 [Icmadophila ericetorum]|nr:hypothetical protein [Icmadophila ericetorum]